MFTYPYRYVLTLVLASSFLLIACSKENPVSAIPDMTSVRANLAFTCTREVDHMPTLKPDADQLFKYARWLDMQPAADYEQIARYYRIAAAHGHYKANGNLQRIVSEGQAASPNHAKETIDLALQLVKDGIPGGYYDIGRYLEIGYGLKQDVEKSLIYYRKSADLGSPDGQYYVGDKLGAWDAAPKIARQMLQCAADQGHGNAARMLANDFRGGDKNYPEALRTFQKAVLAGDARSAAFLADAFASPSFGGLYYLALPEDLERSRRYKLIGEFIDRNESKNPKVPDIDQIVPLPPAKLPDWDGTFAWQKKLDALVPPVKPDEKLVTRLANDKRLDPATGLLIPREPLGTKIKTGAACPESGVWRYTDHHCDHEQIAVREGDPMPGILRYYTRTYAWMPNLVEDLLYNVLPKDPHTLDVTWTLIGYPETKQT